MTWWITFWKVVLIGGTAAYYLLAVFIAPAAFRDVLKLTRALGKAGTEAEPAQ
jgi:hypothetical protein